LRGSIAANSLGSIVDLRREAVGEETGVLHVPVFDYDVVDNFGGFSESLLEFTRSEGKIVAHDVVPMRTVDSLSLPSCALVKADVEGMEMAVIGGAFETIGRCRPALYLEAHRGKARALLLSLDSLGYRLWRHFPPIYAPQESTDAVENPWPGVVSDNILALPAGRSLSSDVIAGFRLNPITDPYRDLP